MLSNVRRVDIEFHSLCNRLCKWCPNVAFKRNKDDIIMSDELYTKILDDLCINNFGKTKLLYSDPLERYKSTSTLSFLGYQEPFTNPNLFKNRVLEAYEKLPKTVQILANTNGDFLEKKHLDGLMLSTLAIMDYDNKGMDYWCDRLKKLEIMVIDINKDTEIIYGIHRYIGSVKVSCNWTNHWQLENRGGFFKQGDLFDMNWKNDMQERDFVCYEPSYNITISHNGDVMPCCHIRSDNPDHKEFILGNLNYETFKDIYSSENYINFRNNLLEVNGNYPNPCKYCQKTRIENYM